MIMCKELKEKQICEVVEREKNENDWKGLKGNYEEWVKKSRIKEYEGEAGENQTLMK